MAPRKHHYLPRFYLRNFSDDGRTLVQVGKRDAHAVVVAINDIAAIRDYHRLDYDDAEDPFELERRLSAIEDELATTLRRVLAEGIADARVHHYLIQLVALLRVRVPAMKDAIASNLRDVVKSTGLLMERRGKLPAPPAGLENAFEHDKVRIKISNWKCLQHMFEMAADEKQIQILFSMQPTLVSAPFGSGFLTCDQPVALYNERFTADTPYGVSLVDPQTEISMPLSARQLLWLRWRRSEVREIEVGSDMVHEFNRRSALMASTYIFAPATLREKACRFARECGQHLAGFQPSQMIDAGNSFLHVGTVRPVLHESHYR